MASRDDLTQLLVAWRHGDEHALEELTPAVYKELHRLARRYMAGERVGHTLQATALVNEAFLRLIDWKNVHWQNRAHFVGVAAKLMRRVLVDHARSRGYAKRGAGAIRVTLADGLLASEQKSAEIYGTCQALWTACVRVHERRLEFCTVAAVTGWPLNLDSAGQLD